MGRPAGAVGSVGPVIVVAVDREALALWVERSCAAQGVPVHVSDPAVLARVGVLLGHGERPRAHGAPAPSTRPVPAPSQPPDRLHAVRVQPVPPGDVGLGDDGVVEDGLDDGDLSGQVQSLPRPA